MSARTCFNWRGNLLILMRVGKDTTHAPPCIKHRLDHMKKDTCNLRIKGHSTHFLVQSMGEQELSEDDISIALGMVEHKDGQIDYQEFLRLIMSPDLPASSRRLQNADSDLTDDRRLSGTDSLKGSFKDLAITRASHDGQIPDAGDGPSIQALHGATSFNRSPGDSGKELQAGSSSNDIQPAESSSVRSLAHSKSSKKRAVLASDQQKMASLWSN